MNAALTILDSPSTLTALLTLVLAGLFGVMVLAWIVQKAARDTGWVDVFWTFGTGAAGVIAALWPLPGDEAWGPRRWLVAALIGLWAARLGGFIAARVVRSREEDARYRELREGWGASYDVKLFGFLLVQAPVGTILAAAAAIAARAPGAGFGLRDGLALAVWLLAVGGESLADAQMAAFRADPSNRGGICERGLWAWSRHPNYFFEWLVWFAWPVLALDPARPVTFATLAAPLVMFLILRFATGVPPVEKSMLASRGDPFRDYQARVNAFIPFPPRRAPSPARPSR